MGFVHGSRAVHREYWKISFQRTKNAVLSRMQISRLASLFVALLCSSGSASESFLDRDFLIEITGPVSAALPLADGRIFIGGNFSSINGFRMIIPLARLGADGTLDVAYSAPLESSFPVNGLFPQSDGKIIVLHEYGVERLNTDGSLDLAFPVANLSGRIFTAALQPDGKLLIGGTFTEVASKSRMRVARFNQDGTLDDTFAPTGFTSDVNSLLVQSDGKIIVGGNFESFGGTSRMGIARLDSSGNLDISFNLGGAALPSGVSKLQFQSDGKILAATFSGLYRLTPSGNRDNAFFYQATSWVSDILEIDGKLIIAGNFSTGGATRRVIARVNPDGSFDNEFNLVVASGTTPVSLSAITKQADGKLLIAGTFDSVDSEPRFNLARLNRSPAAPVPLLTIRQLPSVTLSGTVGVPYRVEYSTNLLSSPWFPLTNIVLQSSPLIYVDYAATDEKRFYRSIANP